MAFLSDKLPSKTWLEAIERRLEMAVSSSSSKDSKENVKEEVVNIARKLCEDYVEDRLIRSGLQLKERKLGAEIEAGDSNRPSRTSVVTRRSRSYSGSNIGGGAKQIPSSSKITRSTSILPTSLGRKDRETTMRLSTIDKKNPEHISRVLVNIGETLETRHSGVYVDVLPQLNINLLSELTLKRAFYGVAKHLFAEGITWAKIVSLFAFTGAVSVDCVINGANMYVGRLKNWTVQVISEDLSEWIILHGGWVRFCNFN